MTKKIDLTPHEKSSRNEHLKLESNYLRGKLKADFADMSYGGITEDHNQLMKFHGSYLQDDRDIRGERPKKKLDKAYSFMIRLRIPGGQVSAEQWQKLDYISETFANKTIKITTRQTFQFHGIIKSNFKPSIQEMNKVCLDTIAACGDVNRNIMCTANPYASDAHDQAHKLAVAISEHLLPKTRAYHELWLDEEMVAGGEEEQEPIYGKQYLPRKFKIVVAVPPMNDVDIYAHDIGFISIVENGKVVGYNITVAGGLGMTHGDTTTFPRTADLLGFCTPEQAVDVAEKIMTVQRDYGNREQRKHARFKYTMEKYGLEWFRKELHSRLGYELQAPKAFHFESNGDRYGWYEDAKGKWHCGLFIQNGRLAGKQKQGMLEISKVLGKGEFILTSNQNAIVANVDKKDKEKIDQLLKEYELHAFDNITGLRRSSMACVALPTCGLALAESERYMPDLITDLENVCESAGLGQDDITIRMTGCPNGCARPYLAEIAFVGRNPNTYNVYLGAAFNGSRLNKIYKEDVKDSDIVALLSPIIKDYAKARNDGEHFGDFTIRKGYVKATTAGNNFHA